MTYLRVLVGGLLGFVLWSHIATAAPETRAEVELRVREATQVLGSRLKERLKSALSTGGPVAALEVCHLEAPVLTREVAEAQGMAVGRTALRVRNARNAPDPWERQQLERFERALQDDPGTGDLEVLEKVIRDNGDADPAVVWRYMKAIPTGDVCLACHGSNLAPAVATAIKARYPDDEAIGFRRGELRGAFTVSLPIAEGR